VNISFNPKLLQQIDKVAQEASRAGRRKGTTPEAIDREIAAYRREKRK
jgi:hypothetical protein